MLFLTLPVLLCPQMPQFRSQAFQITAHRGHFSSPLPSPTLSLLCRYCSLLLVSHHSPLLHRQVDRMQVRDSSFSLYSPISQNLLVIFQIFNSHTQTPHFSLSPKIFVKTLTGRKQAFNFEPSNQVLAVKQALQEKEGILVDQIRLIYSGRQLYVVCLLTPPVYFLCGLTTPFLLAL